MKIHAVAGSKRGTHLMTAVDRLVPLCGEFQRVALSATIRPLQSIADFIGGYTMAGDPREPVYQKRRVAVIESRAEKKVDVSVCFPEDAAENLVNGSRWPVLADSFREIIRKNRSTLLFANSRRLTEKITRLINELEGEIVAYAHHGSLSKEIRLAVEQNLKNGRLKGIVATNSLELGIDVGQLDQVILIQAPPTVSSAVQRIGRSGHRVGLTSKGLLFPTHGRDFLNAAVIARCVREGRIEPMVPVACPLDVLAQLMLSMTCVEVWDIDRLYAFIRTSYAFHDLSRRQFDLVLEMLEGRYSQSRIRELRPKVSVDRIHNTIQARDGVKMLVYMAGGTIPDRGYYNMRISDTKARIGELDEEFVWERKVGETFALGTQTWRIQNITPNDIEVVPAGGNPGIIPFWKAEPRNRDFSLSEKIGLFLMAADDMIDRRQKDFQQNLKKEYGMTDAAAEELISFLQRQKAATESDLPHRCHLLIEHFDDPLNRHDSKQVIVHTIWGGRINRPFAMAFAAAWEAAYSYPLETFADDDAILLLLPHAFSANDLFKMVKPDQVESLLRTQLPRTGYFGARFRENAGRALLLPRAGFKKRMPLWMNRLRAGKLLDATSRTTDFPITLETWRTCLQDDFDLENLKMLLDEIETGKIRISQVHSSAPSPFSAGLIWQQTNQHMYEDDTPTVHNTASGISSDLIREIMGDAGRAQIIPASVFNQLQEKLHRIAPDYSPSTPQDLLDWLKERLLIPQPEWDRLLMAMKRDHGLDQKEILSFLATRAVNLMFPQGNVPLVCAIEILPCLSSAFSLPTGVLQIRPIHPDAPKSLTVIEKNIDIVFSKETDSEETPADVFLAGWLSFYGPVAEDFMQAVFGLPAARMAETVTSLLESDQIVRGEFKKETESREICDRENFEILLRMARRARQPVFQALPLDDFPLFLASWQGLTDSGEMTDDLQERLDQLFGLCLPAAAWEENILPARLNSYHSMWLDSLMQSTGLTWFGCGEKKIGFAFEEDLELYVRSSVEREPDSRLLPGSAGRFGFFDIVNHTGLTSDTVAREIWKQVWEGRLTNDTFLVIRKGILNRFTPEKPISGKKGRRGQFNRWKTSRPMSGNWHAIGNSTQPSDPMEQAEIQKDRVRQLFQRYGVIFRELLSKEIPSLGWASLLPTFRLMELSGEIISGQFFEGIHGLQFASHEAFRRLQRNLPQDSIYWMSAVDPASLCGMRLDIAGVDFPPRLATTHLVFHGRRLVLVSRSSGKQLTISVPPDDHNITAYLTCFQIFLTRNFHPARFILVETINKEPAKDSPYAEPLIKFGFAREYKGLELRKRYE